MTAWLRRLFPVGTRSVLWGIHNPLWHGPTVWVAYLKLYGREAFSLPVIAACFLHDIGYWGCTDMDGGDGLYHPILGAWLLHLLFDRMEWKRWGTMTYRIRPTKWYDFSLFHSRSYAKLAEMHFSKLAVADKLAVTLTPRWFYILLSSLTGEISGYMDMYPVKGLSKWEWLTRLQRKMEKWSWEHREEAQ